jgi:hypothetical protein
MSKQNTSKTNAAATAAQPDSAETVARKPEAKAGARPAPADYQSAYRYLGSLLKAVAPQVKLENTLDGRVGQVDGIVSGLLEQIEGLESEHRCKHIRGNASHWCALAEERAATMQGVVEAARAFTASAVGLEGTSEGAALLAALKEMEAMNVTRD